MRAAPDLATIGRALYGRAWRRDLAEAIGRDESTVGRWLKSGSFPDRARSDMAALCRDRASKLNTIACDLERFDMRAESGCLAPVDHRPGRGG